ncbi:hypothetical protein RCL_jg13538.t1 [Rhizophagus clarus]|uniref:Uncharacterized protein n=1 Tax=Rhizophagus clarus TaxID=94130 RepID=A0A8H3LKT4_9GLOM|nr:hypothetical protein RCL_jg13538.t1 [Rhizophagus clarus]
MKKGFLLTKLAKKVEKLDSSSLVTINFENYDSKTSPSDYFYDIITDFLSDLIAKNSSFFNSIVFSDYNKVEGFFNKNIIPNFQNSLRVEKLYAQHLDMENLRDLMYQSDMSINVDMIDEDLKGLLDDKSGITLSRNNTPLPVIPLTKS